jgi:hypothetical protein
MLNRRFVAAALALSIAAAAGCQSVTSCGDSCGRGSSMAFQKYDCSSDNVCGQCCGESTACGAACGCDGACDSACDGGLLRRILGCTYGCTGCGECYWNEWHNDPPSVCEPCNRCGHYVGPGSTGYYRAPYRHDGFVSQKMQSLPPLEVAEEPADEAEEESLR